MIANKAWAVQMLLVAFSRRICCSRVWSVKRNAGRPRASLETPISRPGMTFERVPGGKVSGMRPAIAQAAHQTLGVADGDIGTPLTRWCQEHQAQQIGRHNHQRTGGMCGLDEGPTIAKRSIGRRILKQDAKDLPSRNDRILRSPTTTSIPNGSARVRTTSMV